MSNASSHFGAAQRFIRDHVRMDPDRAVSRRLQDAWITLNLRDLSRKRHHFEEARRL